MQSPPGPPNPDLRLDQVLKIFTTVPPKFIDDFYSLYDRNNVFTKDYVINLDTLATWLEIEKFKLYETLTNSYTLNRDYIVADKTAQKSQKSKYGGNNYKKIMVTPDCMKRLCMRSRAAKAETVRTYFIKIEEFIATYKTEIVDGLMRNIHEDARRNRAEHRKDGPGNVYVLRAADDPREFLDKVAELNKLGQTKLSIDERLRVYNTGRAKDAEMLTVYKVPFRKEVESCVKKLMNKRRFIKRREIYEVDNEIITKLIEGCNEMSMKLQYVTRKSKLTGPYYIIFTSDLDYTKQ